MVKGKEKFALWITPECKRLVDNCYADDQCQSRSEYIEKAIRFYSGFLHAEKADRYLPKVLQQILSGTLDRFAERIGRQLFKLAVEQNVNNHILASDTDIDARSYTFALSPVAIRQAIAMPSSTYRDQFLKLVDKGYLVQRGEGNTYDFYEVPQRVTRTENESAADGFDFAANVQQETKSVQNRTGEDIEKNINNTNSIINRGVEKQVSPAPKSEFVF